jgi:hypothetical protein
LAKFEITLKGNAALPDFNKEKRENIQNRLAKSEANSAANERFKNHQSNRKK